MRPRQLLKQKLVQLIAEWRAKAQRADDDRYCYTSKWYTSMTDEERKVYNKFCDEAYNHRRFANELEEILKGCV